MNATWECIVVGGGAAGLSAALVLGRARRRTLVIDAGAPSNRVSHGIGGLLGHDTKKPAEFYAEARANVAAYPAVELRAGFVASVVRRLDLPGSGPTTTSDGAPDTAASASGGTFTVILADGTRETTRTVLLATGMDYRRPDVPGLEPLWGGSVFHCPFCHGWEHAGRPLGVLDRGEMGVHRAQLLRAWSDDVTLLTDGPDELDDAQREDLEARGVTIDRRPVAGLDADGGALSAARFADGTTRPLNGLLIPVTLHQRSALATQLGVDFAPESPLSTETIAVDPMGATSVPGVFSAGDASISMPSVANAIAAGSAAAAGVVQRLTSG
ncbi:MAG: NAD(P)/FAD-dependent oxidoreductase [Patulibacter sp.]|nr:NAD(P)/FAD-dependent oxidoreductase [Patulibacter sp.]